MSRHGGSPRETVVDTILLTQYPIRLRVSCASFRILKPANIASPLVGGNSVVSMLMAVVSEKRGKLVRSNKSSNSNND